MKLDQTSLFAMATLAASVCEDGPKIEYQNCDPTPVPSRAVRVPFVPRSSHPARNSP